jgi:hypothetical protein
MAEQTAKFKNQVLRVEGPVTKKLKTALAGPRAVETVLGLLGKEVDAKRPPAWIAFTGSGALAERSPHFSGEG